MPMASATRRGVRPASVNVRLVPNANSREHDNGEDGHDGEPDDSALAKRHNDKGCEKRTSRLPEIATNLKDRLRRAVTAAGRHARHSRAFGMED
jgi:hypothetical protein